MKRFQTALFAVLFLVGLAANGAQTRTTLLLDKEAAKPGETVLAGLQLRMSPNWHTYWHSPGEVGKPTKIDWKLPEGITAGPTQFPVPHKSTSLGLTSYDYSDEIVLLIELKIGVNTVPGDLELIGNVSWLECETDGSCVLGRSEVAAFLVVGGETKRSEDAPVIAAATRKLPTLKTDLVASAKWDGVATGDDRKILIAWQTDGTNADFYPNASDNFAVKAPTEVVSASDGKIVIRKTVTKFEGDWPAQLLGLLVKPEGDHSAGFEVNLPVDNGAASSPAVDAGTSANPAAFAGEKKSIVTWLLFAFIGGLILNIMPCVLPVIALKILGFVNQSKEEPARVRKLGIIYCIGVLASFVAMASVVIAVQSANKVASWGMQFQNPVFLVCMVTLVTLVALNLFGVFEVTLSSGALTSANSLATKEGPTGAFFNGVLATALATPCTAPFLAPALGFAFGQPPSIIILFFLTIGAGLAAPYLVLSFKPAWLKFLPKPGNWMVAFKTAMGFPMLAVAFWLLWVCTKIFGRDGALWIGMFLVCLSVATWVWGEFVQRGTRGRGLAMTISLIFLLGGYGYALERELEWRNPPVQTGDSGIVKSGRDGIEWHPWSTEAVAAARQKGQTVLVDFTADWCLTCKANKKTSIEIDGTKSKLKELNIIAMIGDNTADRPDIALELQKYGRAGVPLVLVYPKDPSKEPIVLPTLLTPGIVQDALDQAAK